MNSPTSQESATSIIESSSSSSLDSLYNNAWTVHVETIPVLPEEIFYIKNVYGEQTVGDFKRLVCSILNRKIKVTKFYHEGEVMNDDYTLSNYNKESSDVCIHHAQVKRSKHTLIRWITAR